MEDFTQTIRQEVARDNYLVTHHTRQRKRERGITYEEIKKTILHGEVIEKSPHARPWPKCLYMYPIQPEKPLYVACGWDGRKARIITIHWRDPKKWLGWRIRRK